jgi:xanthine permease XanP
MGSIVIGLLVGYIISIFLGMTDFSSLANLPVVSVPIPFKFGLDFDFALFIPFALLYVITTIESTGDLTATSLVSGEPIRGDVYIKRIQGGVLGDGVNSMIAAIFNTFPNTTFSQNNGVIQLTGVASRYVGFFIAGFLVLLGIFPIVGGVMQAMPRPVLGGATIIMFGTVAAAGIKIISTSKIDRRNMLILALSLGLGMGVQVVPNVLDAMPTMIKTIFSSPITTGGLTALVLNIIIPRDKEEMAEAHPPV